MWVLDAVAGSQETHAGQRCGGGSVAVPGNDQARSRACGPGRTPGENGTTIYLDQVE